jgi:imidazolonepropionase-like amidohydrolase
MKGDLVGRGRHDRGRGATASRRSARGRRSRCRRGRRRSTWPGRTIIPGLVDEHAHLHYSTLDIFPQQPWKYAANLAYGVTTTHDPSASTHEAFGQSEMVEAGLMKGPRIFSTGFILYGADSSGRAVIESLDDARKHVRRLKSLGAFSVKSYMQPRREQRSGSSRPRARRACWWCPRAAATSRWT